MLVYESFGKGCLIYGCCFVIGYVDKRYILWVFNRIVYEG